MLKRFWNVKLSIRLTVTTLFLLVTSFSIIISLSLQYYFGQENAKQSAITLFNNSAQSANDWLDDFDHRNRTLVDLIAQFPEVRRIHLDSHDDDNRNDEHEVSQLLAKMMEKNAHIYSLYVGYGNGDLFQMVNLEHDPTLRTRYQVSEKTRWLVVCIFEHHGQRIRENAFLDADFNLLSHDEQPSSYRATLRPWYQGAYKTDQIIKTKPYLFYDLQLNGMTYAKRIEGSRNVVGMDISISALSGYLDKHNQFNNEVALIFNQQGQISANSLKRTKRQSTYPTQPLTLSAEQVQDIEALGTINVSNHLDWQPLDYQVSGLPNGYAVDMFKRLASKLTLPIKFNNGHDSKAKRWIERSSGIDVSTQVSQVGNRWQSKPYVWLDVGVYRKGRQQYQTLSSLNGQKIAVANVLRSTEWARQQWPNSDIVEVSSGQDAYRVLEKGQADVVIDIVAVMEHQIHSRSQASVYRQTQLTALPKVGLSFYVQRNKQALIPYLNLAIDALSQREKEAMAERWLNWQEPNSTIKQRIMAGHLPFDSLLERAKSLKAHQYTLYQVNERDGTYSIYIENQGRTSEQEYLAFIVPSDDLFADEMEKVYTSLAITFAVLLVLIPMVSYSTRYIARPVKALAKQSRNIQMRKFDQVRPVNTRISEIRELSESTLEMCAAIQEHESNQQALLDSFIKLIAQAIDEKSPYTGGHCKRVPILAMMLAEKASDDHYPAFETFSFEDEKVKREFEIAAWLHDCGKVTTPEHIVDKGTKLEAITNRIHLVRMRFEVMLRDAKLSYYQALDQGVDSEVAKVNLARREQKLQEDFAFIAQCNIGSEGMSGEDIQRLNMIGQQTWVRYFDDRLGLSPLEVQRLASFPQATLPCVEPLLADKPEHLFTWSTHPSERVDKEIKMPIPEYQANLGELYNLCIERGTLTEEDRYRINEHIVSTINMLEALPLPAELQRVPEIAGGHHETLIGTGYPKQLTKESLSIETRILAVADVFEALTAADRPYKKAKTLSEAVQILSFMVKSKQLDEDVFSLMLREDIHLAYAKRFLSPEQIDDVDKWLYL
ncbi:MULTISPECIES: HD domain-containing phosphohydrolase [unclassified Vibrio]|uniref:HD domain-containing phosphohydrolase n=1 Tax=Vibrio sp. HB236076 TaxID=3232307 RepID=A0AB39HFK0_9VIBR|nr:HD domain-containing phosphohydrolase [Vibrio sp. HB161653]MDP5255487.1 HD domain-containing phosphohydrolase [Vibrio sp. HB161653]